jgi:hypothetical protein
LNTSAAKIKLTRLDVAGSRTLNVGIRVSFSIQLIGLCCLKAVAHPAGKKPRATPRMMSRITIMARAMSPKATGTSLS